MAPRKHGKLSKHRTISTVGHGSRAIEDLVAILKTHAISRVVDIRKMPRSLANPQFNYEILPLSLAEADIAYAHMPALTGLRKPAKASINGAWRNKSFRAFADYMQTEEFADAIDALIAIADGELVALMCAETVPWRCHRSLIADALVCRDVMVRHLMSESKARHHAVPAFARHEGLRVYYPAESTESPS